VGYRRLTGLLLGVVGLALGAVGFAIDQPELGAIGGVAALAAGLAAVVLATPETDAVTVATLARELDALRNQLEATLGTLAEERAAHAEARAALQQAEAEPTLPAEAAVVVEATVDPTDTQLLADPETNLFSEAYFRVALDARIASARRHLRPVAVALLQVAEGTGTPGSPGAEPTKVTGAIRQTLRDADTACRMSDGSFALILEDTPENGAVWTVERIRRNLTSRYGQHTMWAGVACYPAHAFSTDELLDQASMALDAAREWKQDRIEVATAE